uniref:Uncharacterized protein n=1 Tax=Arundo donax TaxID=35708 RepID=A0A0A9C1D6_ARUDO
MILLELLFFICERIHHILLAT